MIKVPHDPEHNTILLLFCIASTQSVSAFIAVNAAIQSAPVSHVVSTEARIRLISELDLCTGIIQNYFLVLPKHEITYY